MILQLCYVSLSICLLLVIWQDIKQRAIHVSLPILVFLASFGINHFKVSLSYSVIFQNTVFVLINIVGLVLYFSLKNKKPINPVNSMIGLGDILFFIALTPLFELRNYILFFILGMAFSLLLHIIIDRFKKQSNVPLAGYLAIFLMGMIFIEKILYLNITNFNI